MPFSHLRSRPMPSVRTLPTYVRERVLACIDRLLEIADHYQGLLPSILDVQSGRMPQTAPPALPGQREGDRARWGCNLMHDLPLLTVIQAIATIDSRTAYEQAVDRYLHRFVARCTNTPSGLFTWGEHAYWRLDTDRPGNSIAEAGQDPLYPLIHDHLRAAPPWLWERLDAIDPACVQRFALGLDYHFKHGLPVEYSRHACVDAGAATLTDTPGYERSGRPRRLTGPRDGANDFPRHSGFYLVDLAFAWSRSGDDRLLELLHRCMDYWWDKRDEQGALPLQSRGRENQRNGAQTLSLAHSLFEAAEILGACSRPAAAELASEMRRRGRRYIELCLTGESADLSTLAEADTPVWGSQYGHSRPIVCRYPLLLTGLFRMTADARLLQMAESLEERLAQTPLPVEANVPAADVGMGLETLADLYDLAGRSIWLDRGLHLAGQAMEVFCERPLPVGASGIHWYEAQLGTGYLIHGLARVAWITEGSTHIPPDYTNR